MQQDKIELVVCNSGSQNCKEHLSIINKCYVEAHNFQLEKNYLNAIESLKSAFFKTANLQEASCLKCADFFRSTIAKSLENINDELQTLTTGFITNKSFLLSYEKSCVVLNDIKKAI